MEAGHGSSSLCHSSDLDGFITVLVCDPSCFDITASVSVFSYDSELHERKVVFKQSDLAMAPVPNRVGGGISPPASHTTGHAGPRPAVPGSPCGRSSTLSLPPGSLPRAQPIGFIPP